MKKPLLFLIAGILFILTAFLSGAFALGNLIMKSLFDAYTDMLFEAILIFAISIAAAAYSLSRYSKISRNSGLTK
ncbi:hypothetical protein [Fontibacillus sp. BL9]|uniref:hypothetical protein n=1 Tax=Fontibacillus sp. BL9 TaxID=3389971 RepID=UPI00397C116A